MTVSGKMPRTLVLPIGAVITCPGKGAQSARLEVAYFWRLGDILPPQDPKLDVIFDEDDLEERYVFILYPLTNAQAEAMKWSVPPVKEWPWMLSRKELQRMLRDQELSYRGCYPDLLENPPEFIANPEGLSLPEPIRTSLTPDEYSGSEAYDTLSGDAFDTLSEDAVSDGVEGNVKMAKELIGQMGQTMGVLQEKGRITPDEVEALLEQMREDQSE